MTDPSGDVTLARAYDPYGVTRDTAHVGSDTSYGFTGEFTENTGMIYLRARYYAPEMGRFMSRDTWGGDNNHPLSYNKWNYTESNPINHTDPSGYCVLWGIMDIPFLNPPSPAPCFGPPQPGTPTPTLPPPHVGVTP